MAERREQIHTLSEQLAQELELLRQFHDVLLEENELLEHRALDSLEDVVSKKQSLLDEFNTAVSKRMQTLQSLGAAGSPGEADETVQECAKGLPAISETWDQLQQLLTDCKEQNEKNGAIIHASTEGLQVALSILTDRTASTELYDAKGKTRHGDSSGSSLAKA